MKNLLWCFASLELRSVWQMITLWLREVYVPSVSQDIVPGKSALVAMAEHICAFSCLGSLSRSIYKPYPLYSQGKMLSTIALIRVVLTAYRLEKRYQKLVSIVEGTVKSISRLPLDAS